METDRSRLHRPSTTVVPRSRGRGEPRCRGLSLPELASTSGRWPASPRACGEARAGGTLDAMKMDVDVVSGRRGEGTARRTLRVRSQELEGRVDVATEHGADPQPAEWKTRVLECGVPLGLQSVKIEFNSRPPGRRIGIRRRRAARGMYEPSRLRFTRAAPPTRSRHGACALSFATAGRPLAQLEGTFRNLDMRRPLHGSTSPDWRLAPRERIGSRLPGATGARGESSANRSSRVHDSPPERLSPWNRGIGSSAIPGAATLRR